MTEKPHILIVEDEVAIQELLKGRLKKLYEISCATYQDEAFAALEKSTFDLVLLDLKLPRNRSDMNPSPDVGVDILRQIRERKINRRGTTDPLPVVVMTAFGKDKLLSADFLQHRGACDYVQKPFGDSKALKRKIEVALCNEGSFSAPLQTTVKVVQLKFNTTEQFVLIEGFKYTGATYKLLRALHDVFLRDYQALKPHDSYQKLRAAQLAGILQIEEEAVRRRVSTFRQQISKDFREGLRRILDENDVVENHRDWNGYRLNPLVVKLVAWEQEMVATPKPR
ncbi:MAG: two-component response regulator [Candidatus Sulfotelmatobacter sp.]|nr:two-component response regulator [Candidatus Sulfotelmatobacter sp.]